MARFFLNGNVFFLAIAQALSGANTVVAYATAAIVGHGLAPDPLLSTLPISIFVIGMAISTISVSMLARQTVCWLALLPVGAALACLLPRMAEDFEPARVNLA